MSEFMAILAASTRRSILANQLGLAKARYHDALRVGYKGGLFEATDQFIATVAIKIDQYEDWGIVIVDINDIPIHIEFKETADFLKKLIEANAIAGRSYLMEYNKLSEAVVEDLIKGDQ